MKFTDGNWLLQPGVHPHHPAEAYELAQEEDGVLTIFAPTRPIRHRGDTLQGPLLTIKISSPMDDVIRVRVEHFTGAPERGPHIPLTVEKNPRTVIAISDSEAIVRAGELSARVLRAAGNWDLSFFANGRTITRSGFRAMGYVQTPAHGEFMHEQLALGVGECVYGLGERFSAFVKNGQIVETWNKDGGTSSEQAYKAVPFYLTNRGYGVLVNDNGPVSFEVASEKNTRIHFSVPGERLEYFVIYGPTPKDVLRKLTALTGRPALPPAWSFGLWLTTSFTTSYDEATVTSFIDGMKTRDLPLHVFHFDCFWMRGFDWCSFQWDAKTFPDPAGMLRRLHERGLRVCVWINPYIAQRSPLFEEGRRGGFLLKRADGSVWQTDQWQPGMGIVDFTNPAARVWFAGHLRRLLEMGVDCFKTDFGERIPTDVVWHDGSDPARMHNYFSVLYNETVFTLIEQVRGKGDAVVFARSSAASGQKFPVHWGGDSNSTFESMAESLRGGLSLGLCGFGFWSHDIGGFEGLPPAAIYKRWVAFGLLSSHSRLHGSSSYRVPWNYDDEACDVVRFFTKLKCRLMPYLYAAAVEAHTTGVPMMRATLVEFPDDPATDHLDRQFFLGGSILVAPVFSDDGSVDFYLPEGRWTHLLSGEAVAGGRWIRAKHNFLSLPIYARPGSVIAFGARDDRPDYEFAEGVTLRAYEIADGARVTCVVPNLRGEESLRVELRRLGSEISVTANRPAPAGAAPAAWQLQLVGIARLASISGATQVEDAAGVVLKPDAGAHAFRCTLPAQ
jgi:alpha-D-xyloside xylohydrolase